MGSTHHRWCSQRRVEQAIARVLFLRHFSSKATRTDRRALGMGKVFRFIALSPVFLAFRAHAGQEGNLHAIDRTYITESRNAAARAALLWVVALLPASLAGCNSLAFLAGAIQGRSPIDGHDMRTRPELATIRPANDRLLGKRGLSNAVNHWPLVFRSHSFGAYTYSTYGCRVRYSSYAKDELGDEMKSASTTLGDRYPENMSADWPLSNFPRPAVIDWRSADGTPHHAEIDIGEIFKDQLVRHNVPREEVGTTYDPQPQIILEVNDRTINVYMKAHVSTKGLQEPGNPYSDSRDDLIKVFSRAY